MSSIIHESVTPKQTLNKSTSQSEIAIQVIAPFTSSNITADIFLRVKSLFPCHFSIFFDPTELKYDKISRSWPWDMSDCLLIMGHEQSVTPKVFAGIQNYLKKGGRVIYWGSIAPDDGAQYELIGARRRSCLSNPCITFTDNSSQIINGIREFYPIGKVPRFTYLAPDCQSLLSAKAGGASSPVAWTRNVGKGKLFYCGLSEESDWLGDDCMTLMLNAIRWVCKNE